MPIGDVMVEIVCAYRDRVPGIMALMLFFGILLTMSLLYLTPGTASYTIAIVDLILIVTGVVIFGGIYWYCPANDIELE